jgi:predicted patatin/cPLA2 family phospholipase
MSWRNLANPKNRSYFGLKFAYDTIPNQLLPFDFDTFDAYSGEVEAVVTNVNSGKAEYLPVPRLDTPNQVLIASCAIPLMFPIIEIDGQSYLDGGCSDPIPWKRALDAGCDRVVVVLSQERSYTKDIDTTLSVVERAFRKYPAFLDTMRSRCERYNACREELFTQEAAGNLMVIAPEDTLGCSRTEKDPEILRALWQQGYFAGRRNAEAIRTFWTE